MAKKDYYEVLGLNKNASGTEIKDAYRKLCKKYHPDMQVGKSESEKSHAEEKFKEISEAYDTLSDADKKSRYDQFGFSGNGGQDFDLGSFFRSHSPFFSDMFNGPGPSFNPFGFDFGSNMGNHVHHSPPDPNRPEDGSSIKVRIHLSFKEAVFGCTKEFSLDSSEPCKDCNGTGVENGSIPEECPNCHGSGVVTIQHGGGGMTFIQRSPCQRCNGTGVISKKCKTCNGKKRTSAVKHIKINIPAGISSGKTLLVQNAGECGVCGGQNGNLLIDVAVEDSNLFRRNGNDIEITWNVSPIAATLGGSIKIPTLYGWKDIELKAGIKSGTVLKIKDFGIKADDHATGCMKVTIMIEPFSKLTMKQEELLSEFSKTLTRKNFQASASDEAEYDKFYKE